MFTFLLNYDIMILSNKPKENIMAENKSSFEKDYATVRNMAFLGYFMNVIGETGRKILAVFFSIVLISMILQSAAVRQVFGNLFWCFGQIFVLIFQVFGLILGIR